MEGKVSIIMPVKNPGNFLQPCLDSILQQSYENWELIAVDDGSTDDSFALLKQYSNEDDRIRVVANTGNGILDALNTGYPLSSGSHITRMDSDDVMPPQKLESMVSASISNSVVTGKVHYFSDEWLVGLGFQNYQNWLNGLCDSGNHWRDLYMECPIPSSGWMIQRDDFNEIGGFDSSLLPEDYDLCFRMRKSGLEVIALNEVIHHWRDSQWRTSRTQPIYFPMSYYPLKVRYFLELDLDPNKELVLWGAGKKGKGIAKLLNEHNQPFRWVTNNKAKWGVTIHGSIPEPENIVEKGKHQLILAVASPDDKIEVNQRISEMGFVLGEDAWWFC